jgi:5'-nucleotidase
VLANPGDLLIAGDKIQRPYPILATDADGIGLPVVTTAGDYKYVGRLVVGFDKDGFISGISKKSGPVRVAGGDKPDAVNPDGFIQKKEVEHVARSAAELAGNVIAYSEMALEGRRNPGVRTKETNLCNLAADALLWQAVQLESYFDLPSPHVALQNASVGVSCRQALCNFIVDGLSGKIKSTDYLEGGEARIKLTNP